MNFKELIARARAAWDVLRNGDKIKLTEWQKRRAIDDFLENSELHIPGCWTPVTNIARYEELSGAAKKARARRERIQALRDAHADQWGEAYGVNIHLVEQAAVAFTINGIKPPQELSDRLYQRYEYNFERVVRLLESTKEERRRFSAPGKLLDFTSTLAEQEGGSGK